jgi:hypothetical protein
VPNVTSLERITARISRVGDANDPAAPVALLILAEFFEGNNVEGSICCNLDPAPSAQKVYELLREIEAQPSVDRILVQITAFDVPEWPFSDTVWVVTTSTEDEVRTWFPEELMPNEFWTGWIEGRSYEAVDIPDGHSVIACWWD